jgi:hypothetical protein
MMQIAWNLTDPFDGFLRNKRFLIMDRDTKYSESFRALLKNAGTDPVRLPYRSPNLNAYAERCVRSAKGECLNKMVFFGERSLRRVWWSRCAVQRFVVPAGESPAPAKVVPAG